jgi:F5/8 type C domain-containing protein
MGSAAMVSHPVMPIRTISALFSLLLFFIPAPAGSQSKHLDDFETVEGWRSVVSDGAKLNLSAGPGKSGKALEMDFEFAGGSGYTIAQKDFPLDLPANYEFTFDMRADAPVNNFEFKLLDSLGNVWWIKKLNIDYPAQWTSEHVKKRQLAFAWGPSGGGEIHRVEKIEFVVSVGTGGKGRVFIDNFRLEPIDDDAARNARAVFTSSSTGEGAGPGFDEHGTLLTGWRGSREQEWLSINFNCLKEVGGLVLDWDKREYATSYDVQISNDGKEWATAYTVGNGNGGRDYIYLPETDTRELKINFRKSGGGNGYRLLRLEVKDPGFSSSANDFFAALAKESPKGYYPKYFLNQQSYWTVVGTSGDSKEGLVNEQGAIEVDKLRFSLEPFLYVGNKLVTWNDVSLGQSLENDYLPIPSVKWKYGGIELTVRAFSAGVAGNSLLLATYTIENKGSSPPKGKLFVAIRPFQVDPPWQKLNLIGGASRIDSIRDEKGVLAVQDKRVIPLSTPSSFGATNFDSGDILEYLKNGMVPPSQSVLDPRGFASGALEYDYDVPSGVTREFHIAVPFHAWNGSPTPNMSDGADVYVSLAHDATVQFWNSNLNKVRISLPAVASPVINTVKSNLAYILINRDGPGIQPGSRSYERSWIRDGSLTSTALLQMGMKEEVKEYLDWYTGYQLPSGRIPCVVDGRGADPTAEHDSHGEYIYAVMRYFDFTKDTAWLRSKFDPVVKTVRAIQSLRAERKTDLYRNGTPEQRACFGLVPQSISHEGYSSKPMHSYWDDFFILRGLKDAAAMAAILGEKHLAGEFAAERDDMRKDLYSSMRLAMKNKSIDYIPGCVELGDFDATSTTIGVNPVNELGSIPEPQLHNTFEKYYDYFKKRRAGAIAWDAYTPYENRVIGTFVYLGQKRRAQEALEFFMRGRHPAAWNEWAEVVHRDSLAPEFIGDMPHTWCGSDFIRSVRAMFVYEREKDTALVVGAGIPEEWLNGPEGVEVRDLPAYDGLLSYSMKKSGGIVRLDLSGSLRVPAGGLVFPSPLERKIKSVRVNGVRARAGRSSEITVRKLPASIEFSY